MSDAGAPAGDGRLRQIADRLEAIASELGEGSLDDARAAELASEAADLSGEAVEEANRRGSEAESAE
jgi:hypothetical protein